MNNGSKVASFDQTEANLDKQPKTYNEFMYDNESGGGILADFDDAAKLIAKIKSDVESLHKKYNQLMGMYDTFTDYNDTMNTIINTMSSNVNDIDKSFKNILNSCHLVISEMISSDNTLIDDLDGINKIIGGKSLDESAMSGHNGMPSDVAEKMYGRSSYTDEQKSKGKITGEDPSSITSSVNNNNYTNNADLASVAEEVIKGNYGVGAERQAALEAQGYNYREVQDIVNQKLKGTYTGETPSGTTTGNNPVSSDSNISSPTNSVVKNTGNVINSPSDPISGNTGTATPVNNNNNNSGVSNQSYTNTGNEYIDLINKIRMDNGLKPLTINNNLESAAGVRAVEASQNWSHTRPDGSKWSTVSNSATGENLAYGYDNANDCVNAWMNSPTHKDVLLADDISSAGLVEYEKDGVKYVALEVS